MQGFDLEKFMGRWYVIEKTSTSSKCMNYNFTRDPEEPEQLLMIQAFQHFILDTVGVSHRTHYAGKLFPDEAKSARMKVSFPLNPGQADLTVVMTDYTKYAAFFTCQKLLVFSRQSAVILAREPELDDSTIEKLRSKLSSYGVNVDSMDVIDHSDCTESAEAEYNLNLDPNTIQTNVGDIGGFLGGGDFIPNLPRPAPPSPTDKPKETTHSGNSPTTSSGGGKITSDAEWL